MRIQGSAYARVQDYFPECSVVVQDLEAHVQSAEAKMFPQKKAQQEAWLQEVVKAVLPQVSHTKLCSGGRTSSRLDTECCWRCAE